MACEGAADEVDFLELEGVEKKLLAASAALEDVDSGVDVHLRDAAVEDELHVAGAFELLEDEVIHAAVGLYQSRSQDSE